MIRFAAFLSCKSPSLRQPLSLSPGAPAALLAPVTMRRCAALTIAIMAVASVTGIDGHAQVYRGGENARALIVEPIDEGKLVTLAGNTHPAVTGAYDRGAVSDNMRLEHMQLLLRRPLELERELLSLIEEQQEKGSPSYHKWLTAQDFGQRFGVAPQDMERVSIWLESHGLHVDGVLTSGMVIEFSGSAGQVKQAFHTEIHSLDVDGVPHFANMSDPQIPAALAGVVKGVHALHNFMPHPLHKAHANFTINDEGSIYYGVSPADMATIYNLNGAFLAGYTGAGQTVVVIEDSLIQNTSDIAAFRSAFGLSTYKGTFSQVAPAGAMTCDNSGVNGAEDEAALDAEWAGASAPNATIELASCADTSTVFGGLIALQNLLNGTSVPPIVSISYGECESENGATANASYVSAYQQAVAEGTSVFVAAGDEGAASCDPNRAVATHGIAVSGFATTPYNVAVGGTDFGDMYNSYQTSGLPLSTYWSTTNTSIFASALSYIPEIPWNDSCASGLIYSLEGYTQSYGSSGFCNSTLGEAGFQTTSAGSGGPSVYEVGNKPNWQSVLGNPSDNTRDIPDVSLFAANGTWGHFLVFCLTDANEGGGPCDYTNAADTVNLAAGGTSFASPILAGIQALVNQAQGESQGNPNARYYSLAAAEFGASGSSTCNSSLGAGEANYCVFNDVTLGDIDLNCTGSTNCYGSAGSGGSAVDGALSTSSASLQSAYAATTGWDFATGLGSINAYNLILNWNGVQTATVVTSGANPAAAGGSVTFTATLTPTFGTGETGTIAWSSNTGCAVSALSSGVATCTTSSLPSGSNTVTATYSGDKSFASSSGAVTQIINGAVSATHFSVTTSASVVAGTPFTITVQALSSANQVVTGYNGTVSFSSSDSAFLKPASLTLSSGTAQVTATLKTAGTQTITATDTTTPSLTGAGSFPVSSGAASSLTISAPSSAASGSPFNFEVGVFDSYGNPATSYAGTIAFSSTDGSARLPSSTTLTAGTGTFSATLTTAGSQTITAADTSNSSLKTTSSSITVTEATAAAAVLSSPAPGSTLPGGSITFTWAAGSGVSAYELWLGITGAGSSGVYNSGAITATSATVPNVPANGTTLYARLYSEVAGKWQYKDYTFIEPGTLAVLTTPKPSSTLSGTGINFTWTAGSGATNYQLWVGANGVGSSGLYDSGPITATSTTVTGIPAYAQTVYVRLYSEIGGVWHYSDYTYTESGTPAVMSSPKPGITLTGTSVTFTWTAGFGNTAYQLWLGANGPGSSGLYHSGSITATSATVTLPALGSTIYARLYSLAGGVWQYADYTYAETGTPAVLSTPTPGSTLGTTNVTFTWTARSGNSSYQLWLGTNGAGSSGLYNSGSITATTATVPSLPQRGATVYARLYSESGGVYQYHDYTFTESGASIDIAPGAAPVQ